MIIKIKIKVKVKMSMNPKNSNSFIHYKILAKFCNDIR